MSKFKLCNDPWFVSIFIISVSLISCEKDIELNNPFDSQVEISAPSDLQIASLSESNLSLTWKNNTKIYNENQAAQALVIIEAGVDGKNFSVLDSVIASSNHGSFNKNFTINHSYYFRTYIRVGSRKTNFSNIVNGIAIFNPPSGFNIISNSENRRVFSWHWKQISEPATSFRIYRKLGITDTFVVLSQVPAGDSTYVDTTVIKTDTTYYFRIYAVTKQNTMSNYDSLTMSIPLPAPSNFICSGNDSNRIVLNWKVNALFPTHSDIEKSIDNSMFYLYVNLSTGINSFVDSNVSKSHTYQYRVTSKTNYNKSGTSEILRCGYQINTFSILRNFNTPFSAGNARGGILSFDNQLVLSVGDIECYIVDFSSGNIIRSIDISNGRNWYVTYFAVNQIALSRNKGIFAYTQDSSIYIYDVKSGSKIRKISSRATTQDIALSSDGQEVFFCNDSGYVQCWNVTDGTMIWSDRFSANIGHAYVSLWLHPENNNLLYGNSSYCKWIDSQTGKIISTENGGPFYHTPAVINNDIIIYTKDDICWNISQDISLFAGPTNVQSFCISNDEDYAIFTDTDNSSKLYNRVTGKTVFIESDLFGWIIYAHLLNKDTQLLLEDQDGKWDIIILNYEWSLY